VITDNGKWKMENGTMEQWNNGTGNGKWKMENGKWEMGNVETQGRASLHT
jgi:hypothetical protein